MNVAPVRGVSDSQQAPTGGAVTPEEAPAGRPTGPPRPTQPWRHQAQPGRLARESEEYGSYPAPSDGSGVASGAGAPSRDYLHWEGILQKYAVAGATLQTVPLSLEMLENAAACRG